MNHQTVLILDFGGQYNQLIARRVRECGVYCEVKPYKMPLEEIKAMKPVGIIFTGGPNSVYLEDSPRISEEIFELGVPVLGICYGIQTMAYLLGGHVTTPDSSEYGKTKTFFDTTSPLFDGLPEEGISWMSHTDYIDKLPEGFKTIAHTADCPVAAMENAEQKLYGFQYHPEVMHTENGLRMLHNFLYNVCGCTGAWTMENYAETSIRSIREKDVYKRQYFYRVVSNAARLEFGKFGVDLVEQAILFLQIVRHSGNLNRQLGRIGDFKGLTALGKHFIGFPDKVQHPGAGDCFNAAYACGNRTFTDDFEQTDFAGIVHMGAAAKLDGIFPNCLLYTSRKRTRGL